MSEMVSLLKSVLEPVVNGTVNNERITFTDRLLFFVLLPVFLLGILLSVFIKKGSVNKK